MVFCFIDTIKCVQEEIGVTPVLKVKPRDYTMTGDQHKKKRKV